jgi:excisionase family DNA binding protein
MRSERYQQQDPDELLTTGEAARILGTSQQHVVDLCDRGDLPFVTVGTHRRIRRGDLEALQTRTNRMTRDQRRSLWIAYVVAGKLAIDPSPVLGKARANLKRLQEIHDRGGPRRWLEEWGVLLDGPVAGILDALTSRSPRSRELRQNSPFSLVLSEAERERVLSAFDRFDKGARE